MTFVVKMFAATFLGDKEVDMVVIEDQATVDKYAEGVRAFVNAIPMSPVPEGITLTEPKWDVITKDNELEETGQVLDDEQRRLYSTGNIVAHHYCTRKIMKDGEVLEELCPFTIVVIEMPLTTEFVPPKEEVKAHVEQVSKPDLKLVSAAPATLQ